MRDRDRQGLLVLLQCSALHPQSMTKHLEKIRQSGVPFPGVYVYISATIFQGVENENLREWIQLISVLCQSLAHSIGHAPHGLLEIIITSHH